MLFYSAAALLGNHEKAISYIYDVIYSRTQFCAILRFYDKDRTFKNAPKFYHNYKVEGDIKTFDTKLKLLFAMKRHITLFGNY